MRKAIRNDSSADALLAWIEQDDADARFFPDWSDESLENVRQLGEPVVAGVEPVEEHAPDTAASETGDGRLVAARELLTVA